MEWVETTAKTVEEAKERALDQLGVGDDDAEFDVLEEPKAGLFGLIRGEARVRARVRPTEVRPKQERRRGRGRDKQSAGSDAAAQESTSSASDDAAAASDADGADDAAASTSSRGRDRGPRRSDRGRGRSDRGRDRDRDGGDERSSRRLDNDEQVEPAQVGEAAEAFMIGLVDAFGVSATTKLTVDDHDLEVAVNGDDLGLLIGPGGRTLLAIQDLARVSAQRRLGDHETRLRIDVAGYRERRKAALEQFARRVAEQVLETGSAKALEPMPSADRKVIHDVLTEIDGVTSRSEGEDPARRVVVVPT